MTKLNIIIKNKYNYKFYSKKDLYYLIIIDNEDIYIIKERFEL